MPSRSGSAEVLAALHSRYGRVSDERLVSGKGIENIYWALGEVGGLKLAPMSDAQIFELAAGRQDSLATQVIDLFFEILGQVVGNFVLATGAFDGGG